MKLYHIAVLSLIGICLLLSSCQRDPAIDDGPQAGDTFTLTGELSLSVPTLPKTYGLTDMERNYVRLLDVLIFDGSMRFLYSAQVQVKDDYYSSPTGNVKTINCNLYYLEGVTYAYAMFIANARSQISEIQEGDTVEEALSKLVFTIPGDRKWKAETSISFDPIPMASGLSYISHNTSGSVGYITLYRSLASVGINYNTSTFYPAEIHLFNVNARGYAAPTNNWGGPSLAPPGNIRHKGPISYYYGERDVNGNPIPTEDIYIAEIDAGSPDTPEENFCVVIGGYYSRNGHLTGWSDEYQRNINYPDPSVPVTYYRLDMRRANSDIYLPINRNTTYNFQINNVRVPGYATVEEAFAAPAFNSDGKVNDFDVEIFVDSENGQFITDGVNFLTIATEDLNHSLSMDGQDLTISSILTNHPDGWTATILNQGEDWMSFPSGSTGSPNQPQDLVITVAPTDTARTGYIYLLAGHLYYSITVGQGTSTVINYEYMNVPADYLENGNEEFVWYTQQLPSTGFSWFSFSNVATSYVTLDVPPAGQQYYPPLPTSCAALENEGYYNWRLPTTKEVYAFTDYCMAQYLVPPANSRDATLSNLATAAYQTGDSNVANEMHVYQISSAYNQNNFPEGTTRYRSSITKTTNNIQHIRCVRTVDEEFYVKTGTHMVMENAAATHPMVIYMKDGHGTIQWQAGDSAFDDIVSSISGPVVEAVENGFSKYTFELTTKDFTDYGANPRTSYFTVTSGDGLYSQIILLTQNPMFGYVLPASRTGLGYELWVASEDQRWNLTWYGYANTPDAYNMAWIPPMGEQVTTDTGFNGSRPYSCASLGSSTGGLDDWRLPNAMELLALSKYFHEESVDLTDVSMYGFNNAGYYLSGEPNTATAVTVARTLYFPNNTLSTYNKNNPTGNHQHNYRARCVRANSEFYSFDTGGSVDMGVYSQPRTFYIASTDGISTTVTKDAKYDAYVSGLTINTTPVYTYGSRSFYQVTLTTREAMTNEDDSFIIKFHSGTSSHSFDLVVNMKGALMYIPESESNLTYDLIMMNENIYGPTNDANYNWYRRANVPNGYNTLEVPPFQGPQVTTGTGPNGAMEHSCAALRWGGYDDWRLPSTEELLAVNAYYSSKTDVGNLSEFGFASANYASAETYDVNVNYSVYRTLNLYVKNAAVNNIGTSNKTNYTYARCVRSGSTEEDFFDGNRRQMAISGFAGQKEVAIFSRTTINTTVTSDDASFATIVNGATITGGAVLPNGMRQYILIFNVNHMASNGTRSTSMKITATDGRVQYVDVKQTQRNYVANLLLAPENQPNLHPTTNTYHNWYHFANVPQGTEANTVPPAGSQLNPAYQYSCAARTELGGGWRLPTLAETANIFNGIIATGARPHEFFDNYQYTSFYLVSASPGLNGTTYYPAQFMSSYYNYNNNTVTSTQRTNKINNLGVQFFVRCVRTP